MVRHDRRPRSSSGIEKAADRQGWRTTSVTHTTSHIHNALSRTSPVLTHFSLTARLTHTHTQVLVHTHTQVLAHTHTQVPQFSQLNPRHSDCIFSETENDFGSPTFLLDVLIDVYDLETCQSYSQTSHLWSSSLSLGLPWPHATQNEWMGFNSHLKKSVWSTRIGRNVPT